MEKAAVVDQNAAERFERVRAHVLEAGPVRRTPHGVADRDAFGREPINSRTAAVSCANAKKGSDLRKSRRKRDLRRPNS